MYVPDRYRPVREQDVWRVVAEHPFATLCALAGDDLELAHLPLVLDEATDGRRRLLGHLSVRNPVHRLLHRPGIRAVAVFHGPHGYLSPDDYVSEGNIPTWNYVVAQVSGPLCPLPDRHRFDQLDRLAAAGERQCHRPPEATRAGWSLAQAPAHLLDELLPHIFFFALEVQRVEAAFKLSQGRGPADLDAQIVALRSRGTRSAGELADLMAATRPADPSEV